MSYLTEAFKQLNIIDEDLFPTDSEGLNKLKDFMKSDIDDEDLTVYDDTATNEDELKNSYDGKVILRCNVCKSYFFKEPKGVVIDAEAGLANVGDECCYCHNDMGYNIVGVVAPYAEGSVEADRAEDVHEEPVEADVEVNESIKKINESKITADDLNRELDKCYGRYNLGCVYGSEDPLAFERAVLKWAKAKSLRVYKTTGYYISEDIVPGINSATGERIESDTLKTFKTADIVFIDNYDKIDDAAKSFVFDIVKERQGHVIVTIPTVGMSSLDAADQNLFKWLDDSDFDASLIDKRYSESKKADKNIEGSLTEETNWDKLDHVIDKFGISRSERKAQPESEEPKDSNFSKIKKTFHKDDLTEETNWDKVKEVISNMKKEKPIEEDLDESLKNISEDLKDVSITTDDTKIQMKSEENGKVTVTTEPVRDEFAMEDTEVIKPLSAADKATIADNDDTEDGGKVLDDAGLDFDEINDDDLDELGEKYFTNVYDNVKSFKSTLCKLTESGVVLEGKIKFKSGKEAKTSFNFNEAYVTKTGKVKLIGENAQFAKNKKAFTLTGSLKDKKLVVESFTYNYRAKDEKTGKSTRLYGTISK